MADIGANIGIYTKWLSDLVGPTGCVYSFEPIPETHDILVSNVRKFKLHNVRLYCCALPDGAGVVEMGVPRSESGGENYYQARVVSADALGVFRRVSAPLQSLDSILAESPQAISFVKCDVEEHELQCVQGAVRTTKRFHPAWSIELSSDPDNPYSNSAAVSRLFTENGYTAYWFDGRRLNQRCRGDSSVNYFFLTPQHLGPLQRAGLIG